VSGVVLTLNAGSSSVKFAGYAVREEGGLADAPIVRGQVAGLNADRPALTIADHGGPEAREALDAGRDHGAALALVLERIEARLAGARVAAVGHRVVHGGLDFSAPTRLTDETAAALARLTPLAPNHQPHNLAGFQAARRRWPDAPHIACFDTAFHRTQSGPAERFALPLALTEEGIIRYGFHGLSYEYIAEAAPRIMGRAPHRRMVVAHLGAGASMCAIRDGASVATTMGFTALDGLPMGTRCGDVDPGVLLYLLQEKGMGVSDLADCLYNRSGLLGMSGVSADMRVLEASDDPHAEEAIAYFAHRCVREIGALAAAMGGLDAVVFTAGVGENAAAFRARVVSGCAWLGMTLDAAANAAHGPRITLAGGAAGDGAPGDQGPSAWVVPTNEERMLARHALNSAGA